jgi:TRAP-type C4-dicarboxylate transport system substrate-binding protein
MKRAKKGRLIYGIGLSVVLSVFLLMCVSAPAEAQEKVIRLRFANYFPPVHAISKMSEEWTKDVEKVTNGRVKISYFPGGTLTPPMQTYDGVVKGISDIGMSMMAYSPGRFPLTEVMALPLGFTSAYQINKVLNEYYKKFKPKEFDDTKVMLFHSPPPGVISTRKPISSLEEIKGLRIKCNAENADIIKAFGGAPVVQPITETYDSLQKGLLDGLMLPVEALKGWRFAEQIATTIDNHAVSYSTSHFIVMNKDKWNSLSREDQRAIEKINEEYIEKFGRLWNQLEIEAREFSVQKGVKIIPVTKEEEAKTTEKMKPILAAWLKEAKVKGLAGDEALKFVQDYMKAHP